MDIRIIAAVKAAGFDVYQRKPDDSWFVFTDGTRIGKLECSRHSGISLSTVHKPNRTTGTGYRIAENLSLADLTKEILSRAFVVAPDWAYLRDATTVMKYRDIEHFRSADSWNAGYAKV